MDERNRRSGEPPLEPPRRFRRARAAARAGFVRAGSRLLRMAGEDGSQKTVRGDLIRLGGWFLGFRQPRPDWTDSPVQRLAYQGHLKAYLRNPLPLRVLELVSGAVLKFREVCYSTKMTIEIRLKGRIDQKALRNFLVIQKEIEIFHRELQPRYGVSLYFAFLRDVQDCERLGELTSLCLLSTRVLNYSFCVDPEEADRLAADVLSIPETRRGVDSRCRFHLDRASDAALARAESEGCRGAFRLVPDLRREVNVLVKALAPGGVVIAVCLRETGDGTVRADDLDALVAACRPFRRDHPGVVFALLNRTSGEQRQWPPGLVPLSERGCGNMALLSCCAMLDGYFGVLDHRGIIARSAGRKGVYVSLDDPSIGALLGRPEALGAALRETVECVLGGEV
jgi:hypothetical protein